MKTISVRIRDGLVKELDDAVSSGKYLNGSDFLRSAIKGRAREKQESGGLKVGID